MSSEQLFEDLLCTFSKTLRDRLLTDRYGRWSDLHPQLLTALCDRMEDEVAFHFSELLEPEVDEHDTTLEIEEDQTTTDCFSKIRP